MIKTHYKIAGAHVAAWTAYVLILFLGSGKAGPTFWTNTTSSLIPVIALFYFNIAYLFPRFLQKRKFLSLTGLLILADLFSVCLRLFLADILQGKVTDNFIDNFFSPVPFWNQFRVNLLFIGISFAYWYAVRSYRSEKDQRELEREILQARLSSLKYQINPHFLYNTLSFIYTKALPGSQEVATAIARLADMMRYSLTDMETDGRVSLEKEIAHIHNFIEIQQLRFANRLNVIVDTGGNTVQSKIMPLLLITFVENAFKHGNLNDPENPLFIKLRASERQLDFEIRNLKATWAKEQAHGIGLQNVCSRLQLAYPERHELVIADSNEYFTVNLKLIS